MRVVWIGTATVNRRPALYPPKVSGGRSVPVIRGEGAPSTADIAETAVAAMTCAWKDPVGVKFGGRVRVEEDTKPFAAVSGQTSCQEVDTDTTEDITSLAGRRSCSGDY